MARLFLSESRGRYAHHRHSCVATQIAPPPLRALSCGARSDVFAESAVLQEFDPTNIEVLLVEGKTRVKYEEWDKAQEVRQPRVPTPCAAGRRDPRRSQR